VLVGRSLVAARSDHAGICGLFYRSAETGALVRPIDKHGAAAAGGASHLFWGIGMSWFNNLSIARKLLLNVCVTLVFSIGLAVFSIAQLSHVAAASNTIAANWLPRVKTLGTMSLSMARTRSFDLQNLMADTIAGHSSNEQSAAIHLSALENASDNYAKLLIEPEDKTSYADIERAIRTFADLHAQIIALINSGQQNEAILLLKSKSTPVYRATITRLDELIAANDKGSEAANQAVLETLRKSEMTLVLGSGVFALLCFTLSSIVSRRIARSMHDAVGVANAVAKGDLLVKIDVSSRDEVGVLLFALSKMTENLRGIVGAVRSSSDTLTSASSEIASGNVDLASRTEQQARALQDTAGVMTQLTLAVQQNADAAGQANQVAVEASDIAMKGGLIVDQVVGTMDQIHDSSNRITDIIGIINRIAFQTNLLALNAAVEAARAGPQGKSFGVVAGEVRTLAKESATAADNIKSLIQTSARHIDDGIDLVGQAGETMRQLLQGVRRVSDYVAEIAAATQDQSTGLLHVSATIAQIDTATQQNAALVEQSTAATASMHDQTRRLRSAVNVFRVDA